MAHVKFSPGCLLRKYSGKIKKKGQDIFAFRLLIHGNICVHKCLQIPGQE